MILGGIYFFWGVGWYDMYETSWIRTWGLEMLTIPSCEISRAWHRIHVFWRTCGLINACWLWVTPIVPMNLGLTNKNLRKTWRVIHRMATFCYPPKSPQLGNFRKDSDNGSGSLPEARWVPCFFIPPAEKHLPHPLIPRCLSFFWTDSVSHCWWRKSITSWYVNMLF